MKGSKRLKSPIQKPIRYFQKIPKNGCKNAGKEIIGIHVLTENNIRENNTESGIKTGFAKQFKFGFFPPAPAKVPVGDKV